MNDTLTTSPEGISLIKSFEGFEPRAYADPVGVPTIGYGATYYPDTGRRVSLQDPSITEAEAVEMLRLQLRRYEQAVARYAQIDLAQNEFDALVSFAYNLGNNALLGSTLLRRLNEGKFDAAADEFLKWNRAGGRELRGLTRRRQAERAMFLGLA